MTWTGTPGMATSPTRLGVLETTWSNSSLDPFARITMLHAQDGSFDRAVWGTWLHEMSNAVRTIEASFRELLEIDGDQQAGIVPMQLAQTETVVEAATA